MQKTCSKCKSELPENAKFCFVCGTAIDNVIDTQKTPQDQIKTSKLGVKTIFVWSSWFFSVFMFLMAFGSLFSQGFVSLLCFLTAGLVVLPLITKKYVKPYLGNKTVWICPLVCVFLFGFGISKMPKPVNNTANKTAITNFSSALPIMTPEQNIAKIKAITTSEQLDKFDKITMTTDLERAEWETKRVQLEKENMARLNAISQKKEKEKKAEEEKVRIEKELKEKQLNNAELLPEYKVIKRDSEELKGRLYKVTGKVIQLQISKVIPESDLYIGVIRLNVSKTQYGDDIIYLTYSGKKLDFFEGDTKEFIVSSTGNYTYESQAKYTITLPSFKIEKVN